MIIPWHRGLCRGHLFSTSNIAAALEGWYGRTIFFPWRWNFLARRPGGTPLMMLVCILAFPPPPTRSCPLQVGAGFAYFQLEASACFSELSDQGEPPRLVPFPRDHCHGRLLVFFFTPQPTCARRILQAESRW